MLARVPVARRTQDVDLAAGTRDLDEAGDALARAVDVDLGDHMTFRYASHVDIGKGNNQPGVLLRSFTFSCIDTDTGVERGPQIKVDVVVGPTPVGTPEVVEPANRLHLARPLITHPYRLYPRGRPDRRQGLRHDELVPRREPQQPRQRPGRPGTPGQDTRRSTSMSCGTPLPPRLRSANSHHSSTSIAGVARTRGTSRRPALGGNAAHSGSALAVTRPDWRGCGVGYVLMGLLPQLVEDLAGDVASTRTIGNCAPAQAGFYQRLGFRVEQPGHHLDLVRFMGSMGALPDDTAQPCWFHRDY